MFKIRRFSDKKYCFKCPVCKHYFNQTPAMLSQGKWCIYCAHLKLCDNEKCEFCFLASFASFDSTIVSCWSKKNKCKPRNIFKSTHRKYIFDCGSCKHEFITGIANITRQHSWCPFPPCSNPPKQLCQSEECEHCFKASVASFDPKKLKCWSPLNILSPRRLFKSGQTECMFECDICSHTFKSKLNNVNTGHWCPYPPCASHLLCQNPKCSHCFNASFASFDPEKLKCWSRVNSMSPRDVFKSTRTEFVFTCATCSHDFQIALCAVMRGNWCQYCAHQILCNMPECVRCHKLSFASFDAQKVQCWSAKNFVTPRDVFKFTHSEYIFNCDSCQHEFQYPLNAVTERCCWCPFPPCGKARLCSNSECKNCFDGSFAGFDPKKVQCWSKTNLETPRMTFRSSAKLPSKQFLHSLLLQSKEKWTTTFNGCEIHVDVHSIHCALSECIVGVTKFFA